MLKKLIITFGVLCLFAVPAMASQDMGPAEINKQKIAEAKKNIKSINSSTLKGWLDDDEKNFFLVDLREPGEVDAAKIEADEFLTIPRGLVEFIVPKKITDVDMTVVVYCKKGGRGVLATETLTSLGYKNVYNLEGGILGWINAGYPVSNFFGSFEFKNFDSNFK